MSHGTKACIYDDKYTGNRMDDRRIVRAVAFR
jgi:hypothetical protein